MERFTPLSPVDGHPLCTKDFNTPENLDHVLTKAEASWKEWKSLTVDDRVAILTAFVERMEAQADEMAKELTEQMGRPIRYTRGEVAGFAYRARHMLRIAPTILSPRPPTILPPMDPTIYTQTLCREPLGVVLVITAWNYPYLVAVNSLIPALVAGNTVVLKGSPQTPGCVERLVQTALQVGLPDGVLQYVHLSNQGTLEAVQHPHVSRVQFTGSVAVGHMIQQAASGRFIGVGLELGGKDAAYVRHDADLMDAVENIVDGAFFNSGQSCCGIERVYVHKDIYQEFVDKCVALVNRYTLGDPTHVETTLGPVIGPAAASRIRAHVQDALDKGAKNLTDMSLFPLDDGTSTFVAPHVLVNVDHSMEVMVQETFGPVVGIMSVQDDDEAIRLINDSAFGLTASIWTSSQQVNHLTSALEVGTVFINRCDYLDPSCAWTGCKDSGRGITLSEYGFDAFTRVKSIHAKYK